MLILFQINYIEDIRIAIADFVDILVITDSKLDQSFPEPQFFVNRFPKPFRRDRNRHGRRLLMYIKEEISQKELSLNLPSNIEIIIIELNINMIKWLVTLLNLMNIFLSLSKSFR